MAAGINCPKCDAALDVEEDELDEGDTLSCDECGATLIVSGVGGILVVGFFYLKLPKLRMVAAPMLATVDAAPLEPVAMPLEKEKAP